MTDWNLKAISENQISNIKSFAKDRKSEMEVIAHYDLTADAIDHLANEEMEDRNYLDNLLSERNMVLMWPVFLLWIGIFKLLVQVKNMKLEN